MTILEGLLVFLSIVFIYFAIVIFLKKKSILEKYNMSLYGPALMIRTNKGKKLVEKIAEKKRFWKAFGSFGVVYCFIVMFIMVFVFVWQFFFLLGLDLTPAQKAGLPGPEMALILPGINPILPLESIFYIILALIVAMIVHEFSHGILTIVSKLKIKSLGLLLIIIPMGAFCEPDEEGLKKTKRTNRMRVYAAGPMSNFVVAFVVLFLFSFVFMSAVQPIDGAEVLYTYDDTPADEIDLSAGTLIISINDTSVDTISDCGYAISEIEPYHTVNISYIYAGKTAHTQVNLTSWFNYTQNESHKNLSFLGVGFNTVKGDYVSSLKNPLMYNFPNGFLNVYILPIAGFYTGYNPLNSPFTDNFEITGPLGVLPDEVFWVIVNALYWIFWLNLLVGMFNVLPIIPFDGGFLYMDGLGSLVKRIKKDISDEKRDFIVKNITLVTSLTILFLVIFPFFFKYI